MVWMASYYLVLKPQDLIVFVYWLYLPSSLSNNLTTALIFIQSNDLLLPIHVALYWYIGRTTCYQDKPLLTFRMNPWWQFSSTRAWSLLLFTRKRLPLVTNSWCNSPVTLYLNYFILFQTFTVDGWDVDCDALDRSRCPEIMEGYGMRPRYRRILQTYSGCFTMVARAGG